MIFTAKHSNVFYAYNKKDGFEALEKAIGCKNGFGLDLFRHNGNVYEGRTGYMVFSESDLPNLASKMETAGGIERFNKEVERIIAKTGESPRYTRPDERKKDIFPPHEKDENIVFAKDSYGKKHYFVRFEYEGIELFTLKKETEYFRQVYVQCEGYMLGIDQHHRLEAIKKWFDELGEGGVKGEVERQFNKSMADPRKWADPGFANILGRADEAEAHNEPIREARKQANRERVAERESRRVAAEKAEKTAYEKAISDAEHSLLNKGRVANIEVLGDKSLIMQLFREHNIAVPLKTQGWIIKSLKDMAYDEQKHGVSYHFRGNDSTVFHELFFRLLAAVQTKQQYEEMTCDNEGIPHLNNQAENEDENDMEI